MKDMYAGLNLPKRKVYVKEARLSRRLLAFLADLLLLDFTVFAAFGSVLPAHPDIVAMFRGIAPVVYAVAVSMALLALGYFTLFEYALGQTPGMMLLGLVAERVTLVKAFVRNAYLIPVFPFPVLWIIEPLYLFWRKQRFLEAITGTRTVELITY